jgi:hypothetical protein
LARIADLPIGRLEREWDLRITRELEIESRHIRAQSLQPRVRSYALRRSIQRWISAEARAQGRQAI